MRSSFFFWGAILQRIVIAATLPSSEVTDLFHDVQVHTTVRLRLTFNNGEAGITGRLEQMC